MVEIYALDISFLPDEGKAGYDQMYALLSEERKARLCVCKQRKKRKQMLGAGVLLGRVLKRNGIRSETVRISEHGKPEAERICFNLSHSGDIVICVVSKLSVGCDVERVKPVSWKLAERFFGEGEKAYLSRFDESSYDLEFCRLWTMKESYVKMTGEGLHLPLSAFEVQMGEEVRIFREGQRQTCYLKEYSLPGYCITVCAGEEEFSEIQWEDL